MKLLTAAALLGVFAMSGLRADAQRGGSRGAVAARGTGSFHGKIAVPASPLTLPRYASSFATTRGPAGGMNGWYRRPTRTSYRRFPGTEFGRPTYGVPFVIAPGAELLYEDPLASDQAQPGDQGDAGASGYPPPYVNPQYAGEPGAPAVAPQPAPDARPLVAGEPVTLIFKDGRPVETIHNYAITLTTLFVFDERRHEIALTDLNVDATIKINREAGVDFRLLHEGRKE